jgi:hypothetical protein
MKAPIIILFLLNFAVSKAQDYTYPEIKKEGKKIADFIPQGWTLLDSAYGDLNKDNLDDLVIILQGNDSILSISDYGLYTDTTTSQPRILAIFFYNNSSKKYELIEQNNSFISTHDNPEAADPYESMLISNEVLSINFQIFYYSGSWVMSNTSYKFRYQNNEFLLIGADDNSMNRGSHDFENYSFNFLAKKWSKSVGNDTIDQKPKQEFHTLDLKTLKTLKTLDKPGTWEVLPDYDL